MRVWPGVAIGLLLPALAFAQTPRPVVGELFTSQGCSSCPPADAKIADLVRTRPDLLLLTFHVTYWNSLGWHDPFSFAAATDRQRHYVSLGVSPEVYTPALVIDGHSDVVGSDGALVGDALAHAKARAETVTRIDLARTPSGVSVMVGSGAGSGTLLLVGFDRLHETAVNRGENGGRTLVEANVVRSMKVLGTWSGKPMRLSAPFPAGEETAVLLQRDDGRIVGAGVAPAAS